MLRSATRGRGLGWQPSRGARSMAGPKKAWRPSWARQKRDRDTAPVARTGETVRVTAQVARVTFNNPSNGYGVVRASIEGEPEPVTLCGVMHGVTEGQVLDVVGSWGVHPQFGEQLIVTQSERVGLDRLANSPTSVALYLAKTVAGVGPVLAQRIVKHFGSDVMEILAAKQPKQLAKVKGVSLRIAENICTSWGEHALEQESRVALAGMGVPFAAHHRLHERWGLDEAAHVVRTEPYRLATEAGLSFAVADRVAATVMVGDDVQEGPRQCYQHSLARYGAASLHALRVAEGQGHCCLPEDTLQQEASALLLKCKYPAGAAQPAPRARGTASDTGASDTGVCLSCGSESAVTRQQLAAAWAQLEEKGVLVSSAAAAEETHCQEERGNEAEPSRVHWYTAKMAAAEQSVALHLDALLGLGKAQSASPNAALGSSVGTAGRLPSYLSEEQRQAVEVAVSGSGGVIVTGGPGCGKTFLMKAVVETFRARGVSVALAAPTGRAAQRLSELVGEGEEGEEGKGLNEGASTLHRLLEYHPTTGFGRNARNPIEASVVVVDEASMLDIWLGQELLKALGPSNSKQLILIGDADQLPPIGPGWALPALPWFAGL